MIELGGSPSFVGNYVASIAVDILAFCPAFLEEATPFPFASKFFTVSYVVCPLLPQVLLSAGRM